MKRTLTRKIEITAEHKKIYIFSDGEKTETIYFKAKRDEVNNRLRRKDVVIKGTGYNTLSLVDFVLNENVDLIFDECWVVFDKDDHEEDFDEAIKKAKAKNLNVAYSNECFELWFLLHFIPLVSAISRKDYNRKINENLNKIIKNPSLKYKKTFNIYPYIKEKEKYAIKNAENLLREYKGETFFKQNPSTTVHLLVESLNSLKNN